MLMFQNNWFNYQSFTTYFVNFDIWIKFFNEMNIICFIYSILLLSLVSSPYILHGQQTPKTNYYSYTYEEDVDRSFFYDYC